MNVFFDLDGTLIDSKDRLYRLFQHLVPESKHSFDSYWQLKKDKISHKEILLREFNYSQEEFLLFERNWMSSIEMEEWISIDRPFDGISGYLKELSSRHHIFVVTARQSEKMLLNQLDSYGWLNLFNKVLVTGQIKEKYDLIKDSVEVRNEDWFVGDTGKDVETGKLLGTRTAAVLSGFLSGDRLAEYCPDVIVENVLELNFK